MRGRTASSASQMSHGKTTLVYLRVCGCAVSGGTNVVDSRKRSDAVELMKSYE